MNDLISKDRLMEDLGISDDCVNCQHRLNGLCLWKPNMVDVCETIAEMPSAERKKGKWIEIPDEVFASTYKCSVCGCAPLLDGYDANYALSPYCPNCGAEMEKGEDE